MTTIASFVKIAGVLAIVSGLSGCSLASLAGVDDTDTGSIDPTAIRPATVMDMMARWYPNMTLDQIRAQIATDMLAEGATQAEVDAKLAAFASVTETTPGVWYDANGKVLGPAYWNPVTGAIVPVTQDGDPSNDAGIAYNPQGVVPNCLPDQCGESVPATPVVSAVDPALVAKHSANYTATGTGTLTTPDGTITDPNAQTSLSANFDTGTVTGGSTISFIDTDNSRETVGVAYTDGVISGRTFTGDAAAIAPTGPDSPVLVTNSGAVSGTFSPDGSTVSGSAAGNGTFRDPDTSLNPFSWTVDFAGSQTPAQ